MKIEDINNDILIKQTQIRVEQNPIQKNELNNQLRVLQLKKEIEVIKMKITRLN